jgi:hypothetical protein
MVGSGFARYCYGDVLLETLLSNMRAGTSSVSPQFEMWPAAREASLARRCGLGSSQ